jgi:hypothetical protein
VYRFVGDSPPHDIGTAFILPTRANFFDRTKYSICMFLFLHVSVGISIYCLIVFPVESQYMILHSVRTEILRGLIIVVASVT